MNDFEDRIAVLLRAQVDHELRGRHEAPQFDAASGAVQGQKRPLSHRHRWEPLAVAACVAILVIGIVAGALAVRHTGSSPATRPTGTAVPTTLPTAPRIVVPTKAGSTRDVDGARIAVPAGWQLSRQDTGTDRYPRLYDITRVGHPDQTYTLFDYGSPAQAAGAYADLDPDKPGFGYGDAPQLVCERGTAIYTSQAARLTFGGRAAEYRRLDSDCPHDTATNQHRYIVGYAVLTDRVWTLVGAPADVGTQGAMAYTAQQSTLPTRSQPLPIADRGKVLAARTDHGQVEVTLQRIISLRQGILRTDETATYEVTAQRWQSAKVRVGSILLIRTNGNSVTSIIGGE